MKNNIPIIQAITKVQFDRLMQENNLNDNNINDKKTSAFISITSFDELDNKHWFNSNHDNVLNIRFHDYEYETSKGIDADYSRIFNETHAKEIIDFLKRNKHAQHIVVHCTAGESRSGAVASFIRQMFTVNLELFKELNPNIRPNKRILNILNYVYSDQIMKEEQHLI